MKNNREESNMGCEWMPTGLVEVGDLGMILLPLSLYIGHAEPVPFLCSETASGRGLGGVCLCIWGRGSWLWSGRLRVPSLDIELRATLKQDHRMAVLSCPAGYPTAGGLAFYK